MPKSLINGGSERRPSRRAGRVRATNKL